eukprot:750625-Hanusia_phi.AAC.3
MVSLPVRGGVDLLVSTFNGHLYRKTISNTSDEGKCRRGGVGSAKGSQGAVRAREKSAEEKLAKLEVEIAQVLAEIIQVKKDLAEADRHDSNQDASLKSDLQSLELSLRERKESMMIRRIWIQEEIEHLRGIRLLLTKNSSTYQDMAISWRKSEAVPD